MDESYYGFWIWSVQLPWNWTFIIQIYNPSSHQIDAEVEQNYSYHVEGTISLGLWFQFQLTNPVNLDSDSKNGLCVIKQEP